MSLSILKKALLATLGFILIYLSIVAVWATSSVEVLLDKEAVNGGEVQLSKKQVTILLAIEDPTFYHHAGIDVSRGQGLTTITSSIARDIFLFRQTLSGVRGVFQGFYAAVFKCCKKVDIGRDVMALVLNSYLTKEKQLSFYTSNSYMGSHNGEGVFGLSEASQAYYKQPLSTLTNRKFIGLVAMLKAPNRFHPIRYPVAHQLRTDNIEQIVLGKCNPSGWFDTSYQHCEKDT